MDKKIKIGLSGSYGGLNLGDEAILQGIISEIRKSPAPFEITVFSRNANDTLKRHKVDRAIPVREYTPNEILPEIKRLDVFVLGGGGILFNGEAKKFLRDVDLAIQYNVPVMVYAVGTGPLTDINVLNFLKDTFNKVSAITVREKNDQKFLQEIGVNKEIVVTADPGFLIKPEPLPESALKYEGIADKKNIVGISVREPGPAAPDIDENVYHALLADAADFMVDRFNAEVIFIPMEQKDIQHSHAVISKMLQASKATVLKGTYTSGQILSIIGNLTFAVGMRLHFLIFSALQGVPFVALPYATKVSGLLQDLKIETPPLKLVNAGRVNAYIDRFWDRKESLKQGISKKIIGLRQKALENNRILMDLVDKTLEEKKQLLQKVEKDKKNAPTTTPTL